MIIPKEIIRSNRRSISIIINKRAEVIVRAPINCDDRRIFDFIKQKQGWISSKINEIKVSTKVLNLIDGELIDILGETYIIQLTDKSRVKLNMSFIYIPKENSRKSLVAFLKRLAHKYLTDRVADIAKTYDFKYNAIKITSAKTRWGSCNYNNALNFTYKLMLTPKQIIDYIIIHELVHTKVKNHSKRFYSLLEKIMPNYKNAEKWLKVNRSIIELI